MTSTSAPGRVNLIGEHTDYNDGFVLPTPIPQRTYIELEKRTDDRVVVWSREMGAWGEYRLGEERPQRQWLDYVMGCTEVLRIAGHHLGGIDVRIASDVPLGSGLSSSASLEVAFLRALREAFGLRIDDVELAFLGQRTETTFVGAPVGAMDQLAASLGRPSAALFIDLRNLEIKSVPLPAADLIVINSGLAHDHATGDYRTRRMECEKAARLIGVPALRDLGVQDLDRIARLPSPLDRRARHVVTENARVLAAVEAIEHENLRRLGELFGESHASMRDDFEVSLPAIDRLVAVATEEPLVFGARLTGGGFGGSIVALAAVGMGTRVANRIAATYANETGNTPQILVAGDPPCDPS